MLVTQPWTQTVKNLPAMQETWARSLGREDPLEKEMATHSSILAWRIPRTEEPGGLQSTGSQRVGHDWATSLSLWLSLWSNSHIHTWLLEKPKLWLDGPLLAKSLLFNTLSRFVRAFLTRCKCLLISWLQLPSAVILFSWAPKSLQMVLQSWN